MSSPTFVLPLATATFNFETGLAGLIDLDYRWRSFSQGIVCNLIGGINADATEIVVSAITKTFSQSSSPNTPPYGQVQTNQTVVTISLGSCLLLEDEPMTVTAVSAADANLNYTLTVVRGTAQQSPVNGALAFPFAVPVPHAAGTSVSVLQYFSPSEYVRQRGWIPLLQDAVGARGSSSAIYTSTANIQIQLPPTTTTP